MKRKNKFLLVFFLGIISLKVSAATSSFTVANNSLCIGYGHTDFTNTSTFTIPSGSHWAWDFGDGSYIQVNPTVMHVSHTYANPGVYIISLIALASNGSENSETQKVIEIFPTIACQSACPTLGFSVPFDGICNNRATNFVNTTFFPSGSSSGVNFQWNFGDGSATIATAGPTQVSHHFTGAGTYTITLTETGPGRCTSSLQKVVTVGGQPTLPNGSLFTINPTAAYSGSTVTFTYHGNLTYQHYSLDFGDGSPGLTSSSGYVPSIPVSHTYTLTGNAQSHTYTITFDFGNAECIGTLQQKLDVTVPPPHPCQDCIGSFQPIVNKEYLLSAWTKENKADPSKTSYTFPSIQLSFTDSVTGNALLPNPPAMVPSGEIIDGWQRIEATFTVPNTAGNMNIRLLSANGDCFFDDIRVFPFDGSMKSYVYDPTTLRLVAELDERNYATKYEYDKEGKLIRLKKETERGFMTIKENKNSTKKR